MPDKYSRSFRLAFAIILLLAGSAISQTHAETLPLKHFTTSDGLAHDRVNRIVRDSRGLLWFCTAEGLSRFDGYQFKNYTRDEGMPHGSITDFLELPDGRYWVATGDGLVLFNPQGLARRWRGFENNSTTADESLMFRVFRPTKFNPRINSWRVLRIQMGSGGIGSSLTRISLLSEVAHRRGNEAAASDDGSLLRIAGLSREVVDAMSDIVWAINPERDSLGDLTQRMRHFASDVFNARGIDFRFRLPDSAQDIRLGANFRREVFLIFKEAVNNVVRHSQCGEAEIEFRVDAERNLHLKFTDNGEGFNLSSQSNGHGLASMRERTQGLGGKLEIASTPGKGTVLLFDIPLSLP
jgi:two-component sensor histidine kinase